MLNKSSGRSISGGPVVAKRDRSAHLELADLVHGGHAVGQVQLNIVLLGRGVQVLHRDEENMLLVAQGGRTARTYAYDQSLVHQQL